MALFYVSYFDFKNRRIPLSAVNRVSLWACAGYHAFSHVESKQPL